MIRNKVGGAIPHAPKGKPFKIAGGERLTEETLYERILENEFFDKVWATAAAEV